MRLVRSSVEQRRARLFRIAAAAAIATAAPAVHAELFSANHVTGIQASMAVSTGSICAGSQTAIAAGIDSDGLNVVLLENLVPVLPGAQTPFHVDAGSYVAQDQFWWTAFNDGQADHVIAYDAICAPFAATTVTGDPLLVPVNDAGADRVLCPAGSFATGGGIDDDRSDLVTSSTGPVLDDGSADGLRLNAAADGPGAAPIGWRASARFAHGSLVEAVARVAVVCIPGSLTTQIASVTVPAASFESQRVLCPNGMIAYGGGVDGNAVGQMTVTATAPVFDDGTASGQRLISRPYGPDAAPIGWFGAMRNDDSADHVLKVAAICPEPLTDELAFAAISALVATRRKRR